MNELQGLKYIDESGNYCGIIEQNTNNEYGQSTICYKTENAYKCIHISHENFKLFSSCLILKSNRYDIIKERNIRHIYHFSPISNLESIAEYGLLSQKEASRRRIRFDSTDPLRLDGELDKISASISFPNYKMRYKLEECDGLRLVIFDIEPRLLLSDLDIQFYFTNAANNLFKSYDKRKLETNTALINMFDNSCREPNLPIQYTTDPQAEILVDKEIKREFISGVITPRYYECVDEVCEEKRLSYSLDSHLFGPRCDYRRW